MTCRNLPIPVIAMVESACVGGGHELMLLCDLMIATEDSNLAMDHPEPAAARLLGIGA